MQEVDYKSRYETAVAMLAQCDNKYYLIGEYEIRKLEGKWWLMRAGSRILDYINPVDAVLAAKDLMASKKAAMARSRAALVEADPT